MEFRLLGPVTVVDGDRELSVRQRRQRALLGLLLLHVGEAVAVDRILDELWGADAPRTALASVHNAVSKLRALVGADSLVTRAPGYVLDVEPEQVDARRFEHLLAEAQAAFSVQDHATAAVVLREALALWRGPALADLTYEPFAQAEIRRLEELRESAVEERLEADLARGKHEEVVPELERLVADAPLRERPHRLLMLALYRSGRQADALAAYRAARRTLVAELGIEPGPDLKQLEQAILRQDPSLLLPGAAAVGTATPARSRRLATIVLADAVVTRADGGGLDPELLHDALSGYVDAARTVIRRHGGWVDRVAGEGLMAAFGAQAADEAHTHRAAQAALDLRAAVATLGERLAARGARVELRVGVAAGEVLVSGSVASGLFVSGEAVRLASGLQQAAGAGEIVVGPLTRRLLGAAAVVEPLGELELRGRPRPVAPFRLVALGGADAATAQMAETPYVGRANELRRLRAALRAARRDGTVRPVCVIGPAGIGKSRLARELARGAKGVDVLVAHCRDHGEGLTYLPVRELVGRDREAVAEVLEGIPGTEHDAELLTSFAGPAPEIARAFTRWCEARAGRRPLLLVVDDLHRAEPTFLDLLEHTAAHANGPIVVLGLARDELVDERPDVLPGWERLELEGLALGETETLVDRLLAGAQLPSASRTRVFDAAEGNPLFVEQLVALAAEGEALEEERPLPATVQALLAARLDRLGPGERAVLERAAVVGREFAATHVTALLDPEGVPTASRHLASLARRGFVDAHEETYRFRHVLLQEAAYRATPKSLRSELHERLADALDGDGGAPEAIVGYHLEQAYRLRTELGPPDRAAQRIAEDGGRRLGAAGIRAWKRYDAPAAVNLLDRAVALLPREDVGRLELLSELGEVLKWRAEPDRALAVLGETEEIASSIGDTRLAARARVQQAWVRFVRGETDAEKMLELTSRAIRIFEAYEDHRALAIAWRMVGAVHGPIRFEWAACADAARRAYEHFARAGFSPAPCLVMLGEALKEGPDPVESALEQCERFVASAAGDPIVDAHMRVVLAELEGMRGNVDRAREHLRTSRDMIATRGGGDSFDWAKCAAALELDAGDHDAAARILDAACTAAEQSGEHAWVATLSALLAEVRYDQGRVDLALELSTKAMTLALDDDLVSQVGWRRARAKALARRGDAAESERLAGDALARLGTSDALCERAATMVDLAEVLHLASRHDEAEAVEREALALLERKGNTAALDRAVRRLSELHPAPSA